MSLQNYYERQTQALLQQSPNAPKLEAHQAPDDWTRQVINNEMDRIRAENDRKWREQQK